MKRAKLIVIEGTDGSGKETQCKKLEEYYSNKKLNTADNKPEYITIHNTYF